MSSERGGVSMLVAGVIIPSALFGIALLVAVAQLATARAGAQGVADAAALAAAPVTFHPFGTSGDPTGEARAIAGAGGLRLDRCTCRMDTTWNPRVVVVEVSGRVAVLGRFPVTVTAAAAAEFRPVALLE